MCSTLVSIFDNTLALLKYSAGDYSGTREGVAFPGFSKCSTIISSLSRTKELRTCSCACILSKYKWHPQGFLWRAWLSLVEADEPSLSSSESYTLAYPPIYGENLCHPRRNRPQEMWETKQNNIKGKIIVENEHRHMSVVSFRNTSFFSSAWFFAQNIR